MPRPFWSGSIQISLVSFRVKLFPAVEARNEIHFHQLSRKTGERVHHQKVAGGDGAASAVAKDEIVKGYEYRKGEYVRIEPSEIENLRIPSRTTLAVTQFVDLSELDPGLFEKPYFVVPDGKDQAEAFAVIREALQTTRKAALGKIAFSGREHVMAICAPPGSEKSKDAAARGMMAYTLRYAEELRNPAEYFAEIKEPAAIDRDQLALARELIERKSAPFAPENFHDEYEAALKAMVEAKVNNAPVPKDEPAPRTGNVVNLMDALRKSVSSTTSEAPAATTAATPQARKKPAKAATAKKGLSLVKGSAKPSAKAAARTRRSA